jgi:excisionase family DNA binding protein
VSDLPQALAPCLEALAEQIARRVHELSAERAAREAEAASPWLGIERAAGYLDLPTQRLYKLSAAGAIPHYKQGGRLLFHRGELDGWLRGQAHATSSEGPLSVHPKAELLLLNMATGPRTSSATRERC